MSHYLAPSIAVCLVGLLATACAGIPAIYADTDAPPGARRVALVVQRATRSEILQEEDMHQALLASGLRDEDIADDRVIAVAVHCCDGPDALTYGIAYAPPALELAQGDIVEILVGTGPDGEGLARLNVVTRVREPHGADPSRCNWIPNEPGLWRRTIYCDWMPSEGWVEVRSWGLPILWMKPPR